MLTDNVSAIHDDFRPGNELGRFLRARREQLTPEDCGLMWSGRRRTPGLRRDEVAMLARISLTWYTFLEQGRAVRASAETIGRLADVLRLNEEDRRKLASLAGLSAHHVPELGPLPKALYRIVEALEPLPAFALNHLFDIVVWNAGSQALWHHAAPAPDARHNFLWRLFTDPIHYPFGNDWIIAASLALKHFRTVYERRADAKLDALVMELSEFSSEFRRLWTRTDSPSEDPDHVFRIQVDGHTIDTRFAYLSVFAAGDYMLCTLAPIDNPSREALQSIHENWTQKLDHSPAASRPVAASPA
jgi:transcriptional regulator with XRE-family HTH domain